MRQSAKSPSAPVVVRPARADEYAAAGDLVVTAYREGGLLVGDRGYDVVLRDVAGRVDDSLVLVAVREGVLVGTVTIARAGSRHAEVAVVGETEFRYLGVHPDSWGTGVAQSLVVACEEQARQCGDDWIVLSVIDNNVAALGLYAHLGFERLPERDWEPAPSVRLLVSRRAVSES